MELAQLIGDRLSCAPETDALEFEGRWFQWSEIQAVASRISDLLNEFAPGNGRVGIVARNRPAVVAALAVLLATRRPVVMVNPAQSEEALRAELAGLDLQAVVADVEDLSPSVLDSLGDGGIAAIGLLSNLDGAVLQVPGRAAEQVSRDDEAAVHILTSGTTGKPKRIPLEHRSLNSAAAALVEVDPDRGGSSHAAPDIIVFPVANISGLYFLLPALAAGRRVVLLEKFTLAGWLDAVRRCGAEYSAVPPTAIKRLLDANLLPDELGQLKSVGVGSAPLDPDLQERFEDYFGIPVTIGYGATEFAGVVATWTPDDRRDFGRSKRGSVGRAVPGVGLRVVDLASGVEAPTGSLGVQEAVVPRIGENPIRTNDLASIDDDGFVFLRGREDQVIIRGGFKVHPGAVAGVLESHPSVRDAAVIGIPDADLGEVPVAVVELKVGAWHPTEGDLMSHARAQLRAYELPRKVIIVDELPRTPSMKVELAGVRAIVGSGM
jgi:acyl-CoA synthetase (AMP-forming)/AMP-acid ligase II